MFEPVLVYINEDFCANFGILAAAQTLTGDICNIECLYHKSTFLSLFFPL